MIYLFIRISIINLVNHPSLSPLIPGWPGGSNEQKVPESVLPSGLARQWPKTLANSLDRSCLHKDIFFLESLSHCTVCLTLLQRFLWLFRCPLCGTLRSLRTICWGLHSFHRMNILVFALHGDSCLGTGGHGWPHLSGWLQPLKNITNFVAGKRNISILGSLANRGVVFLCCILDCFLAVTVFQSVCKLLPRHAIISPGMVVNIMYNPGTVMCLHLHLHLSILSVKLILFFFFSVQFGKENTKLKFMLRFHPYVFDALYTLISNF